MDYWIDYLSGNVPGGILLYLVVLLATFLILFFMYRVNELFTRKLLVRWTIIAFLILTVIYSLIWFKNPPAHLLKRYAVYLKTTDPANAWFAHYLTELVQNNTQLYVSEWEYLFPSEWFFRITPADLGDSPEFRESVFRKTPIQRVLKGEITVLENAFKIRLMLTQYPGGEVTVLGENRFNMYNANQFISWIREQSSHRFPIVTSGGPESLHAPDSLLTMLKIQFYKQNYQQCLKTLALARDRENAHPEIDIWKQYIHIRLVGLDSQKNPITNPFEKNLPDWQKNMQIARNRLLDYLRLGKIEKRMDLMIAESYLWEKDFASAEIFLKKEFVENPFDIAVLANLAYLHPSRYREFQFGDAMEIRRRILELCPVEEDVLIKWSDLILLGNPSYTAPPKKAQERVEKYLSINPQSYRGWLIHGKILAHALKRKEALESYFKADSLAPQNGLVQYNIGIVYYELKNLSLAEDYMKKAIDYQNYLDAYLYLGTILKEQGKYEEALEKFRYRVKNKTGDDDYYAQQAMKGIQECLTALGQNP